MRRSLTEFSVDFFLEQNKNFLVSMGIFGALTIYLTQLSSNETVKDLMPIFKTSLGEFSWFDLGVSASLIIFLCFASIVFIRLLGIFNNDPSAFEFNIGNIVRIILIIPFAILIFSISSYVPIVLSAPIQFISIFITGFMGTLFFFGSLKLFSLSTSKLWIRWLESFILFILFLFVAGWAVIINNYFIASFFLMFNALNFLYILGFPILVLIERLKKGNSIQK